MKSRKTSAPVESTMASGEPNAPPLKHIVVSTESAALGYRVTPTVLKALPVMVGNINKYFHLEQKIGRGAFSVVYRAKELYGDKRTVALKVCDFNVFHAEAERIKQQRFLEGELALLDVMELKIGAHPNFPRVYSVCRDPENLRVAIAMELLTGGELFDRIVRKTRYSERDAAELIRSVFKGLKDLHSLGIIHCDLKPENLLYANPSDDSPIKITDFGLSKMVGLQDMHAGSLVGTAQYVAPECILRKEYGTPCDVWSMGVVLYILLCGYPPFNGKTNPEVFTAIKRGRFEFHERYWKNVSSEAKQLVVRMLEMDPQRRITVDGVLEDPWVRKNTCVANPGSPDVSLDPAVLENLRSFNAKRKLKAAAMAVMLGARFGVKKRLVEMVEKSPVNNFTLEQLGKLRESFKKYASADSRINKDGFAKALEELGYSKNVPVDALFKLFDHAGEGSISYRAFLTHLSTLKDNGEDAIRFCFDVYDENGDGCLSKEELSSVLTNLLFVDSRFSPDERGDVARMDAVNAYIEDMFERLDSDKNGTIDFEEFKQGILKDKVLVQSILEPIRELS